ncbi:MAG: LysM peptidoglycan-binding domain-containing protein [Candidatus Saganbacteria bacterium]|nr:LysM peptidoglycan-binding domain-containing protein [Candidatus Saganbacteria bacterium]
MFLALFVAYFVINSKVDLFANTKHNPKTIEPKQGVNFALKDKAFFPYKNGNLNEGVKYAIASINKNIGAAEINIVTDDTVNSAPTKDGLYNANWVSKVVLVVEEDITGNKYYIVKKGDNLWNLSKKYLGNPWRYPELAKMSGISNPSLIYKDNLVKVPQAKKSAAKAKAAKKK